MSCSISNIRYLTLCKSKHNNSSLLSRPVHRLPGICTFKHHKNISSVSYAGDRRGQTATETKPSSLSSRQDLKKKQRKSASLSSVDDDSFNFNEFLGSDLPRKLTVLLGLIALSRIGVYIRLPGVDVDGFSAMMQNSGLMGYLDTLSGGSISKVGLFSLGIIPYINSSIVLQLLAAASPRLKKLQREEGAQGRALFQYYQKLGAFVFAVVQVGMGGGPGSMVRLALRSRWWGGTRVMQCARQARIHAHTNPLHACAPTHPIWPCHL